MRSHRCFLNPAHAFRKLAERAAFELPSQEQQAALVEAQPRPVQAPQRAVDHNRSAQRLRIR
jgi:hypothetical protein